MTVVVEFVPHPWDVALVFGALLGLWAGVVWVVDRLTGDVERRAFRD